LLSAKWLRMSVHGIDYHTCYNHIHLQNGTDRL
jgi:hypothetical protein